MRKIALILFATIATLYCHCRTPYCVQKDSPVDSTEASISFEKTRIALGTINKQSTPKVPITFRFTNKGRKPLVIHNVQASCGCTTVEYPHHPIMPGAQDSLSVVYDSRRSAGGKFEKSIAVYTNGQTETTYIYIEGRVSEQ